MNMDEKKEPTVEEPGKTGKKSKAGLILLIILVIAILSITAYFLVFNKQGSETANSPEIQQMQEMTQQVQGMETDVKQKENEILNSMDEYKKKTGGQSLDLNALKLSDDERKLLEDRIANEQDVSVKSLLKDILDKNKEIQELKEKISEIEKKLPVPHVVKAHENHFQIALNFLVKEKGLEKKQARELIERAALLDTLVPGFKVYNFYADGEYGTSVTQGTALVSPNTLIRKAKKQLVDARDEAISERDKVSEDRDRLSNDITVLEEKRNEIIRQLEILAKERESLIRKVGDLNAQVNSLSYVVDTEKNLKDKQVLKGGFLRTTKLKDLPPELFNASMDLRSNTQIKISASDLGIDKIKEITLFPKIFTEGTDYKVEMSSDKQTATLTLMTTAKFKNEKLVISVI